MKPTRLEVTITQKRSRFLATCDAFPGCKGSGENREAALSSLSRSIGRHVAKSATRAMDTVLSSDDFTQMISPMPMATDESREKRVYRLDDVLPVQLQPEPVVQHVPVNMSLDEDQLEEALSEVMQVMGSEPAFDDHDDFPYPPMRQSKFKRLDDDGAFGILMSLN